LLATEHTEGTEVIQSLSVFSVTSVAIHLGFYPGRLAVPMFN